MNRRPEDEKALAIRTTTIKIHSCNSMQIQWMYIPVWISKKSIYAPFLKNRDELRVY